MHRDIRIDAVKGILELLIILEHNSLITSAIPELRPIVNSFCVGCFMLLTFTREVKNYSFIKYINKYFIYIIPFFIFVTLSALLNFLIFQGMTTSVFFENYIEMLSWQSAVAIKGSAGFAFFWFLPCLCMMYLLRYLHMKIGVVFLISMIFIHLTIGMVPENTLTNFPFTIHPALFLFILGFVYHRVHKKFVEDNKFGMFSFFIFIILICINPFIPHGLLMFAGVLPDVTGVTQLLYYDTILLFSFPGIFYFTKILPKAFTIFLSFIGKNSLWVYLSHQFFFVLFNNFIKVNLGGFFVYLLTILLSCFFSYIITKFKPLLSVIFPRNISDLPRNLLSLFYFKNLKIKSS